MMRASHKQPGFAAALLHRLSGIALAIFLPLHFLTLATALGGANAFDSFLALTNTPLVKASECALVAALATHMAAADEHAAIHHGNAWVLFPRLTVADASKEVVKLAM